MGLDIYSSDIYKMDDKTIDEIHNYYKLKNDYTQQVNKLKKSILNNDELSRSDKQKRFRILRPKCVNCKNPVGSIFTLKDRTLVALCGATQNTHGGKFEPCSLNIQIKRPHIMSIDNMIEVLTENSETVKEDIISTKVKSIFGLIPQENAISEFEEFKNNYAEINKLYLQAKSKYDDLVNNNEKKDNIKSIQKNIHNKITEIKTLLNNDSLNEQLSRDAVEIYINTLIPMLDNLNSEKFTHMDVEYNEDEDKYYLIQEEHTIVDFEFST